MGTYLSTPVLDKHVEKGDDLEDSTPCRWAVVDMQGWRKSMEDAHVARTDVPLPCCSSGPGNDDDGGGGGGEGTISNAKVFAVFDGHGGAEVARFCQVSLVPVLTSQEAWKNMSIAGNKESSDDADGNNDDDEAAAMEKEEAEEEEFDHINPEAKSLGKALIDSFHALDRLIDDPNSRGEIDSWRTERPPPYVSGGEETKEEDEGQTDSSETENTDGTELQPIEKGEDVQERRHTAMDQNELADSVAKLQEVLATAADDDDEKEEKAVECDTNDSSETDSDDIENKAADGTVNDDSDDDEKVEVSNANENDDGEIVDTADSDEEEKGTVTLSSSDAVALFQKLLHLNVTDEDDDSDEDDEDEGNAKLNGYAEGETQDSQEVVIPTKEQLLNPPTGIVAPSASVPTKIQNGRKVSLVGTSPPHTYF